MRRRTLHRHVCNVSALTVTYAAWSTSAPGRRRGLLCRKAPMMGRWTGRCAICSLRCGLATRTPSNSLSQSMRAGCIGARGASGSPRVKRRTSRRMSSSRSSRPSTGSKGAHRSVRGSSEFSTAKPRSGVGHVGATPVKSRWTTCSRGSSTRMEGGSSHQPPPIGS